MIELFELQYWDGNTGKKVKSIYFNNFQFSSENDMQNWIIEYLGAFQKNGFYLFACYRKNVLFKSSINNN